MDIPAIPPSAPAADRRKATAEPSVEGPARRSATDEANRRDPAASKSTPAKTQDLPRPELEQVVEVLNVRAQMIHRNLQFAVDDSSGRTVITLSDSRTGEVIRQIPSDAVLRLAERLADKTPDGVGAGDLSTSRGRRGLTDDGVGALLDTEL